MKILLFGATGPTGLELLKLLTQLGHEVKALVRNPEKLNHLKTANLKLIRGDVFESSSYSEEMQGVDVVISSLGTRKISKPTTVYSEGGKNIIAAMRAADVKRFICLTAGAFDMTDPGNRGIFVRFILNPMLRNLYNDMILLENLLEDTPDLDWICTRPTRLISRDGTGKYRVKLNHRPAGGGKISHKDLADFIIKQLSSIEYIHKKPVIAY